MINNKVIESIGWLLSLFDIKLLTFIAAGFTIYFGYQKITKKVCVSYSISGSRLYELHVPAIVLSNKRDNTLSISKINMEIQNKGTMNLFKFETPLLLKSYESQKIELPKYSSLFNSDGEVRIEAMDKLQFSLITTSGEEVNCENESHLTHKDISNQIIVREHKLNDIVLTKRMSYILFYKIDTLEKHVVIDKSYFFNGDNPFHFNILNPWSESLFREALIEFGYHDRFSDYMFFRINENLQTDMLFNKKSIESYFSDVD